MRTALYSRQTNHHEERVMSTEREEGWADREIDIKREKIMNFFIKVICCQ